MITSEIWAEKTFKLLAKTFRPIVKNDFYESIETNWDFLKNVNMFTPNWQIRRKKMNLLKKNSLVIYITTEIKNQMNVQDCQNERTNRIVLLNQFRSVGLAFSAVGDFPWRRKMKSINE